MGKKSVLSKQEKEKVLKEVAPKEKIEVDTAISWDGASFLIRIPKEMSDYFNLNKKNRMKFIVKEDNGEIKKEFDIIK